MIIGYVDRDTDADETGMDVNQENEPTAIYMGSPSTEDDSFQLYDNGQSLDIQGRGSKRPRYNNDDNYQLAKRSDL